MKQSLFRRMTIATAVLLTGAFAFAQQQSMGQQSMPAQQTPNTGVQQMQQMRQMQSGQEPPMQRMEDQAFVQAALQGGMAEVKLGNLAEQKGASADVRQFGEKMVADHTQLNNLIKQVAAKEQMRDPKGITKKEKKLYAKLSALSGTQFDNAYIKAMLKAHKDDLDNFRTESINSQNPMIKQAATEGSQMIRGHLKLIQQIAEAHSVKA